MPFPRVALLICTIQQLVVAAEIEELQNLDSSPAATGHSSSHHRRLKTMPDTFYHYTDKEGMRKIRESGELRPSEPGIWNDDGAPAANGRGTYFTDLSPKNGKEKILENNYGGITSSNRNKADYVVEIKREDLETYGKNMYQMPWRSNVYTQRNGRWWFDSAEPINLKQVKAKTKSTSGRLPCWLAGPYTWGTAPWKRRLDDCVSDEDEANLDNIEDHFAENAEMEAESVARGYDLALDDSTIEAGAQVAYKTSIASLNMADSAIGRVESVAAVTQDEAKRGIIHGFDEGLKDSSNFVLEAEETPNDVQEIIDTAVAQAGHDAFEGTVDSEANQLEGEDAGEENDAEDVGDEEAGADAAAEEDAGMSILDYLPFFFPPLELMKKNGLGGPGAGIALVCLFFSAGFSACALITFRSRRMIRIGQGLNTVLLRSEGEV